MAHQELDSIVLTWTRGEQSFSHVFYTVEAADEHIAALKKEGVAFTAVNRWVWRDG